jgi:hypothetical protein
VAFTTTELLEKVKLAGCVPTSQNLFTTARLLGIADDVMGDDLLPFILRARENYFEYNVDYSISSSTEAYDISSRAIGGVLSNLALINGTQRKDIPWIAEDDVQDYTQALNGAPIGGFLRGARIFLVPPDGLGYPTLRSTILLSPGKFVETSAAAQILTINTGTKTLTFASHPSTWLVSSTFDLVQQKPHFDTLGIDLAVSAISDTSLTFSATLPTRLAVGDWISLAGETAVVQAPKEFHSYLARRTAERALRSMGDHKGADRLSEELKETQKNLGMLIQPRIQKEGKKLVNRTGILRSTRGR